MIRTALASLANTWHNFTTPTSESMGYAPIPAFRPTNFIIQTRFLPPTSLRIYNYCIQHAHAPAMLMEPALEDLMGNPVTAKEIMRALDEYYSKVGPIKAHTVVLDAQNWIGRFFVEENTNTDMLVICLVNGPAASALGMQGPDARIAKELA